MKKTPAENLKQAKLFPRPYRSLKAELHRSFCKAVLPTLTVKSDQNLERRPLLSEYFVFWYAVGLYGLVLLKALEHD